MVPRIFCLSMGTGSGDTEIQGLNWLGTWSPGIKWVWDQMRSNPNFKIFYLRKWEIYSPHLHVWTFRGIALLCSKRKQSVTRLNHLQNMHPTSHEWPNDCLKSDAGQCTKDSNSDYCSNYFNFFLNFNYFTLDAWMNNVASDFKHTIWKKRKRKIKVQETFGKVHVF